MSASKATPCAAHFMRGNARSSKSPLLLCSLAVALCCLAALALGQGVRAWADQGPATAYGTISIGAAAPSAQGTVYGLEAVFDNPFGDPQGGPDQRYVIPLDRVVGSGPGSALGVGSQYRAKVSGLVTVGDEASYSELQNADGVSTWDDSAGVAVSQTLVFRASSPDARWTGTVPQHCVFHVSGTQKTYGAGEAVTLTPGQQFYLTTDDPFAFRGAGGVMKAKGTITAPRTVRVQGHLSAPLTQASNGDEYLPDRQHVDEDFDTLATVGSPVVADAGYSVKWTATIEYIVDGSPVFTDTSPLVAHYHIPPFIPIIASKPQATPGLDSGKWQDENNNLFVDGAALTGDLKLYNHNRVTITFEHGDKQGPNPDDPAAAPTKLYAHRLDANPIAKTWDDLLPRSIVTNWGQKTKLPGPVDGLDTLYVVSDDGRWKSIRRSDEGWHMSPVGADAAFSSVAPEGDTTVYDDWSHSVIDAVTSE